MEVSSKRVLWVIPLAYVLLVTADMLASTHLSLLLTDRGASALAVGGLASAFWVSIMLASLAATRLIARHGLARCFIAGTALSATAFVALALVDRYQAWLAAMAVLGAAVGLIWIAGEAWLAESAPAQWRGFYVGLVETSVGAGTLFGPLLLPAVRWGGWDPLVVALGTEVCASILCLLLLAGQPEGRAVSSAGSPMAALEGWRDVALPLMALAAIGGALESASSALLPSISMRSGYSVNLAASLAAVIGAGAALLPTPFGLLADRAGMRRILLLSWCGLIGAALALAAASAGGVARASPALWPCGFLVSGLGAVIYTLATVELGHRLTGPALVRALAMTVTAYTCGTASGPVAGGALFDAGGLPLLALVQAGAGVAGLAVALRTGRRAPARPQDSSSALSALRARE